MEVEAALDNCPKRMHAADAETVEDTCPRLKSTERTNAGNSEAAEPIWSEAGMALEAVLALKAVLALEAV